jgi:hypothetical protein
MEKMSLKEFVAQVGPAQAARMLGMSHPPLIRAAASDRKIFITLLPGGKVEGTELSDFPPAKKKAAPD